MELARLRQRDTGSAVPTCATDDEPAVRRGELRGPRVLRGDRPNQSAFDILNDRSAGRDPSRRPPNTIRRPSGRKFASNRSTRGPGGKVLGDPVPVGKMNQCCRVPTGAASTHLPSGDRSSGIAVTQPNGIRTVGPSKIDRACCASASEHLGHEHRSSIRRECFWRRTIEPPEISRLSVTRRQARASHPGDGAREQHTAVGEDIVYRQKFRCRRKDHAFFSVRRHGSEGRTRTILRADLR